VAEIGPILSSQEWDMKEIFTVSALLVKLLSNHGTYCLQTNVRKIVYTENRQQKMPVRVPCNPQYKDTLYFTKEKSGKKKGFRTELNMSFSSGGCKQKEIKLYNYEIINAKYNALNKDWPESRLT
jgi:hypothetical protein